MRLVNPLKTYRAGCSSKFRLEHSFVKERAIESRSKRRVESKRNHVHIPSKPPENLEEGGYSEP